MCSVHDTVEFEKRGIPATMILTSVFTNAAVHQFRARGLEGHPFIELPHPISNLTPAKMREVTLRYVDQIVRHLTT
ncbi:MAG: hypothetical protein JWM26_4271 [Betaproteobacteria bacterium]|nr:hypothetical protein [Betaproteobacteria bacterium]